MSAVLQGQVILNTRPAHQQALLTDVLQQDSALVLSFPAIAIEASDKTEFNRKLGAGIAQYDVLVFVSRNAVDAAFGWIGDANLGSCRLAVIGEASRQALAAYVPDLQQRLISSQPYNSEALLTADELQSVSGQKILILRGQEGRNLLGDTLQSRGASVSYAEVYRRTMPHSSASDFDQLVSAQFPTLAVFTSNEGMQNLLQLVAGASRERLLGIPWLLISERMRESALNLGHKASIIIAHSASDKGIHKTICEWANQ